MKRFHALALSVAGVLAGVASSAPAGAAPGHHSPSVWQVCPGLDDEPDCSIRIRRDLGVDPDVEIGVSSDEIDSAGLDDEPTDRTPTGDWLCFGGVPRIGRVVYCV